MNGSKVEWPLPAEVEAGWLANRSSLPIALPPRAVGKEEEEGAVVVVVVATAPCGGALELGERKLPKWKAGAAAGTEFELELVAAVVVAVVVVATVGLSNALGCPWPEPNEVPSGLGDWKGAENDVEGGVIMVGVFGFQAWVADPFGGEARDVGGVTLC